MVPTLVTEARRLAEEAGFTRSSRDEVGALLAVLAGTVDEGPILEIGTGFGVGTAWLVEAGARRIYTVEEDGATAAAAARLFALYPQVQVICGDWTEGLTHAPFGFVFVDVKSAKTTIEGAGAVVQALAQGGLVVLDDLTAEEFWPDDWRGRSDPVRDIWLLHPRLQSVEIRTSARHSLILGRKL